MNDSKMIPAKCRECGRVFGMVSFIEWQKGVRPLHGVVCSQCGSRADARDAKTTIPEPVTASPTTPQPTQTTQQKPPKKE